MITKKQFRYLYRHYLFNRQIQDERAKLRACPGSLDWRFITAPIDCLWEIEVETALLLHEPLATARARLEFLYQQKNQQGGDEVFQRSTRQELEARRQLRLWRWKWRDRHGKAGK